jgi:hypothetical protein
MIPMFFYKLEKSRVVEIRRDLSERVKTKVCEVGRGEGKERRERRDRRKRGGLRVLTMKGNFAER